MESPKQLPENSQVQIMPSHSDPPALFEPSYPSHLEPGMQEDDPFRAWLEYWHILKRRKYLIVLAILIGALGGLFFSLYREPLYRARISMEIQGYQDGLSNPSTVDPNATYMATQIDIIKSSTLRDRVTSKMTPDSLSESPVSKDLLAPWRKALGLSASTRSEAWEKAVQIARETLDIISTRISHIIVLQCDSTDPKVAAKFINGVAEEYIAQNQEERWNTYQNTSEWLNKAQAQLKAKLEASEQELQQFARVSGLLITSETQNVAEDKLRQLQSELSRATAERIARQAKYEETNSSGPEALPEVLDSGPMGTYQVQLADLRRQLAELSSALTPEHYKIKRLQAQISELESALQRERNNIIKRTRNEYETALRGENQIRSEYDRQANLILAQADDLIKYRILKRGAEMNRQLYEIALQKGKEASIASALHTSNARVIDPAKPPRRPYKPVIALNVSVGFTCGLVFAAIFVIFRERLRSSMKMPGYLPMQLSVRELGVIPSATIDRAAYPSTNHRIMSGFTWRTSFPGGKVLFNPDCKEPREDQLPDTLELVTWNQKPSVMAEAFRATMASILFSADSQAGAQVIVFTSPSPGEGKTTAATNIAIALAEINRHVLLVDGDMRLPRLHRVFGVANNRGLSDLLQERTPIEECSIQERVYKTKIPGLVILPSGLAQANVSALLHSSRLPEFLSHCRREFEIVLIDAPPLLNVPDARILGRASDSVIIVFRANSTTRDAAMAAVRCFDEDGIPILGTILNDLNPDDAGYGSYRSAYSYPYRAYR